MIQSVGVELKNVRKVYPRKLFDQLTSIAMAALGRPSETAGTRIALDELNMSIRAGERVGVIGRNGAGKSTLLQMLAGITEPSSGILTISGKVTAVLTLGIGLREDLTGRENIYLDGEVQGKTRENINAHVDDVVKFAELGKFIDLPLRTYSTGMKARLAFAMITQIEPEILIIDEALSVGDAAFSLKAGRRISQLCTQGAIVIIVSHSMQSIRDLCNRCIWLDTGRMVMDDVPEIVTNSYVESIRETDQVDHASRFQGLVGTKSFLYGYTLDEISISSDGHRLSQLMSGKPLQIDCKWHAVKLKIIGQFFLRCIRLDGVLISEHSVPHDEISKNQSLRMTYPRFNLAPGLYRLQLEWVGLQGEKLAESNAIIEIIAHDPPMGGRPALLDVGSVQSIILTKAI